MTCYWQEKRGYKRTMAKAIPTNAPILLMTGVQSAPKIPLASNSAGSLLLALLSLIVSLGSEFSFSFSSQSVSTHGSKLPNATPAIPQKIRYLHSPVGLMIPSTGNGANFLSLCRCLTNNPYNIPSPNSVTPRSTKPIATRGPEVAGRTTDFRRYGLGEVCGDSAPTPHGVESSSRSDE